MKKTKQNKLERETNNLEGRFDKVYKELGIGKEDSWGRESIYEMLDKDQSIEDEVKDYVAFRCGKKKWGKNGLWLYRRTRLEDYSHGGSDGLTQIMLSTEVGCYGAGIEMSETDKITFKNGKFVRGNLRYTTGG